MVGVALGCFVVFNDETYKKNLPLEGSVVQWSKDCLSRQGPGFQSASVTSFMTLGEPVTQLPLASVSSLVKQGI